MHVVEAEFVSRAMTAATELAGELHLRADDAVVIHNSNKLALRLLPCGVFARVALVGQEVAALEVELAVRLAGTASPAAALEPRVEPRVYERDGFAVTLWTYYEVVAPDLDLPGAYADVLQRLHTGMRSVEIATPHFLHRAAEAERLVTHRDETPRSVRPTGISSSARCKALVNGSTAAVLPSSCCTANRILATSSAPVTACCSSTSKRAAVDPSSLMSPTCHRTSARAIRTSIKFCSRSAGGSCLRWSLPGAGTSATNSRMGTSTAETSCPCSARARRGPHSVLSPASSGTPSHAAFRWLLSPRTGPVLHLELLANRLGQALRPLTHRASRA